MVVSQKVGVGTDIGSGFGLLRSNPDNCFCKFFCEGIIQIVLVVVQDPDHVFDFRGLRLDWSRLQSYLSSGKGSVLEKQRELAALLNTVR